MRLRSSFQMKIIVHTFLVIQDGSGVNYLRNICFVQNEKYKISFVSISEMVSLWSLNETHISGVILCNSLPPPPQPPSCRDLEKDWTLLTSAFLFSFSVFKPMMLEFLVRNIFLIATLHLCCPGQRLNKWIFLIHLPDSVLTLIVAFFRRTSWK